jgi:hypothetical protein
MAEQAIVEEFKKLFQDQQLQQQFVANQGAYVGEHFPPGCTPQDLAEGAQEALQSSGINQGAYAGYGGGAPPYTGGEAGLVQQIAYYTSVYNNTTIDDRDVAINNQINALGDVEVDNTVASGDGAVAFGENADLDDVGIATGANSTAAGDVDGSVAGAGGTAIGGSGSTTVEDSQIQSANAGGDITQQQQDVDVDLPEPPPPPPPPNGGDPGGDPPA